MILQLFLTYLQKIRRLHFIAMQVQLFITITDITVNIISRCYYRRAAFMNG